MYHKTWTGSAGSSGTLTPWVQMFRHGCYCSRATWKSSHDRKPVLKILHDSLLGRRFWWPDLCTWLDVTEWVESVKIPWLKNKNKHTQKAKLPLSPYEMLQAHYRKVRKKRKEKERNEWMNKLRKAEKIWRRIHNFALRDNHVSVLVFLWLPPRPYEYEWFAYEYEHGTTLPPLT